MSLEAGAVAAGNGQAITDGVTTLYRDPGIKLALLFIRCIIWIPADGSGLDQ